MLAPLQRVDDKVNRRPGTVPDKTREALYEIECAIAPLIDEYVHDELHRRDMKRAIKKIVRNILLKGVGLARRDKAQENLKRDRRRRAQGDREAASKSETSKH